MTRENKLALVVGFALILFIGILISDHFSVARNQASANLTDQQIADPLSARARDEENLIAVKLPPAAPPADALLQPGQPAVSPSKMAALEQMTPEQHSMIDRNGGVMQASQRGTEVPSGGAAGSRIPQHVEPVNSAAQTNSNEIQTVTSRTGEIIIPQFENAGDAENVINLADMRFHNVASGESLFAICQDYYGDTSLVKPLAQFNKMDDPAQVSVGRKLMIPPPESLGGKAKAKPSAKPDRPATTSALTVVVDATPKSGTAGAAKPAAKNKTYTVKSGDSLSGIAQRILGDKDRWRDLHKLNRKVIDDPDNLKVGTIIRLS